jgi:O-antigen ligase
MTNERKVGNSSKSGWQGIAEEALLFLSLFLMSWRMRYEIQGGEVLGVYIEYSSWHLYLTDLVILALLLVWWRRKREKLKFPPEIIHWPLLFFLIWTTASVLWAEDKITALMIAGRWWLFWGWFMYLINEVKSLMTMIWPVALGALLQAGIGVVQYIANSSLGLQFFGEPILIPSQGGVPVVQLGEVRQIRANGLMPHANMLGGFLAAVLPFLVYGLTQLKKGAEKNWLFIVVGISSVALALSFSRAAWLGFVPALMILIWNTGLKKYWKVLIASGGIFIATLFTQYSAFVHRVLVDDSLEAKSIMERFDGWNYWQLVVERAPVWGVGIGNYIQELIHIEPGQSGWWYQPIHNIYLLIIGELGLVGVAFLIWLLVGVIRLVWNKWQKKKSELSLVVGPLLAFLVIGLFDHWPVSMQQGKILIFWALAVLIIGYQFWGERNKV